MDRYRRVGSALQTAGLMVILAVAVVGFMTGARWTLQIIMSLVGVNGFGWAITSWRAGLRRNVPFWLANGSLSSLAAVATWRLWPIVLVLGFLGSALSFTVAACVTMLASMADVRRRAEADTVNRLLQERIGP
jgi:hypothetical protein